MNSDRTQAPQKSADGKENVLALNEIYPSLQGEGANCGMPVVFLRTFGCNLQCGFCDTPYTWEPRVVQDSDRKMYTAKEAVEEITSLPNHSHWVITGGEPMLQQLTLVALIRYYQEVTEVVPFIEWETNGTILPSEDTDSVTDKYNVSVKLKNSMCSGKSYNTPERRIIPPVIEFFAKNPKADFKFVIAKEADLQEAESLIRRFEINRTHVVFMPEGKTAEEIKIKSAKIFNYCVAKGYRFSTRLHVAIFGMKRGI